jgi:hypothetical protein
LKYLQDLSSIRVKRYGMMLNNRHLMISGILVVLFLFSAGCTQSQVPAPSQASVPGTPVASLEPASTVVSAGSAPVATKEDRAAFVREAVAYARTNGKEKALAEFSNKNGSFFRGELYIYAYDYNGTTIAHPVNPEKIGVNRLDEKDAEGILFIRELRDATTNGTGFVTYTYINPTRDNRVEKKLGYVMKVDDTWWLGSGIYLGPADTPVRAPS